MRYVMIFMVLGISLVGMLASSVYARETVVSTKADDVNVTVYRDPNRGERPINANWPGGYALITETRKITIKAGESIIRFEGVSEGMFPESAIVSGLPEGVSEKNRDERLLSPFGLIDAYLKRRVTIKRTSRETGMVTEKNVFITAGPNGGVIFESDEGFEALRCTGLPERMVYDIIPSDLSVKPTLSVITQSDRDVTAKLTLTYLASGFDWQANYIANVKSDTLNKKLDLFAWMTVANGGNQSFDNANLMAIAGTPNREHRGDQIRPTGQGLRLQCWPQGRTHQVGIRGLFPLSQPLSIALESSACDECDTIIVTAQRRSNKLQDVPIAIIQAEQENLGDLKLYRVPERVDVKSKGQKQVAMIVQPNVEYKRIFVADIADYEEFSDPIYYILRAKNNKDKGLGVPLPSGRFTVFEASGFGPLLIGEGTLGDSAIDNKVELAMSEVADVRLSVQNIKSDKRHKLYKAVITNALDHSVQVEVAIPYQLSKKYKNIRQVDGIPTWFATVPANGESKLSYSIKLEKQ